LAGIVLLIGGLVLSGLFMLPSIRRGWQLLLLGLAVGVLYWRTLLPSVGQADTFEFQVVVPALGVAHPTGYPLYVLLTKPFTWLPLGNVAWRVNLASAVYATAAVLTLFLLLRQLLLDLGTPQEGLEWPAALAAALGLAVSPVFWSQAVVAEVYALHHWFVVVILGLLLFPIPGWKPTRRWQVICFLIGLSFTNHLTTALLLPAVTLAWLWERPRGRTVDWLVAGGLMLLGLSVYLFIPLRWPALNDGARMTLAEFLAYVTGDQFHGALRLDGWLDPVRWTIVGRLLREPFGWAGLGLAAVGTARLGIRHLRAFVLTGVTFLGFVLYGLDYYVADVSVFVLPAHGVLALWLGLGLDWCIAGLSRCCAALCPRRPALAGRWGALVGAGVACLLPLSAIWTNFPRVDQSQNQGGDAWGEYVLSLPLEPNSAVLADVTKFAPLYYVQQIEGLRPDLDILLLGTEAQYHEELAARLGADQTVYLARYLPNLGGLFLRSVGPVVQVNQRPSAEVVVPAGSGSPSDLGTEIRLLGRQLDPDPLGRPLYHLTLYWQAMAPVSGDFLVRLRLVDEAGQVQWESGGVRPVGGLYPTNGWPVEAVISDYHALSPPPWLPPGRYTVEVGLFPPFVERGLAVDGGPAEWLTLDRLDVGEGMRSAVGSALPQRRRSLFSGGEWLTGHDQAGEGMAGSPFVVALAWRGVEQDREIRLVWVDERGQEAGGAVFPLAAGMVCSRYVITAPQEAGRYTLHVGMRGAAVHCGWLAPAVDDCALASVEVSPAWDGEANFAGLVLLLGAEVEVDGEEARSGEEIPVTLRWRALRGMEQDYTVFVQLIGPDGQLHGQEDAWPVQGTYPTSQWNVGEEVFDPYRVRVSAAAPPGSYRVEVGWYLLTTMERLPVLDERGRPVGDSFVAGAFSVVE